jgi:site-specific DNA-methyltransferase (adenine-specific)
MEINKIYQGDCLEVMKGFPDKSIDMILTDPPYGIDYQSAWRTATLRKDKINNDKTPFIQWLKDAYRITKDTGTLMCFCRWDVQEQFRSKIEEAGYIIKSQVIWDRMIHGMGDLKGSFAPQHDIIWFATKGNFKFPDKRPTSIIRSQRVDAEKLLHPNEKPISLMKKIILSLTKKEEIILDPMCGGGSTLLAAKELGRKYIGIEISPEYCKIANERLAQNMLF